MQKHGLTLLLAAAVALLGLQVRDVVAQEYVGVLPELLNPEVAEQIGLDEKQQEEIKALVRNRLSAAVGLGQALREAPVSQTAVLRAEFAAESEAMGFKLLSPEQQEKLSKYRVSWMGLLSLDEPDVAKALNLADWQKELVSNWRGKVRSERRGPDADRTRAQAERTIRQEISESQFAAWQVLAGQIAESTVGTPEPPPRDVPGIAVAANATAPVADGDATQPQMAIVDNGELPIDDVRLTLNFAATPWSEAIAWLAEQADLSVQSDVVPPGTFKYRDKSRTYSVTETLDLMNGRLLNAGYTLFRQGRMLRCINFENEKIVGEVLKEIADSVDEAELAKRGKYEPVKYLFTLDRLDPEVVKAEVEQLLSIQGSVVSLPASGQLLVTDMAGNLRTIASYIKRAEDPTSSRGATIQTMPLKNITAEEVLSVARPLLGLEEGINVSEELSISTNTFGTTIYARGAADKIESLRDLVEQMDKPVDESEATTVSIELPYIDRHKVVGIDLTLAYEVVSQLLAGGAPDTKLATDETAKQLVLFARKDDHKLVNETLDKLAGDAFGFEVIQLTRLDTLTAIELVKKFLGLADSATAESGQPIIDGNMAARQIWVKGTEAQVKQINSVIEKLEANAENTDVLGDRFRVLKASGNSAMSTIQQVEALWGQAYGGKSRIRVLNNNGGEAASGMGLQQRTFSPRNRNRPGSALPDTRPENASPATKPAPESVDEQVDERAVEPAIEEAGSEEAGPEEAGPEEAEIDSQAKRSARSAASPRYVAKQDTGTQDTGESPSDTGSQGGDIIIMESPGGLIVSSDDKEALERFNALWLLVTEQSGLGVDEPTIVYLRNIKASAAKELLETILSGSSGSESGGGSLLGDMASSVLGGMGGMMGGLMGGGDLVGSTSGIASGDYSIVADPRLNCLIVKAGVSDMLLIEKLLEVIDQVESPFQIDTRGQFAAIPVISQDVNNVLNTIKGLFGDRIAGGAAAGGAGGPGGPGGGGGRGEQPNPADIINALRGGGRGGRGGGASTELSEPKISIAAETTTNTLLVLAQPSQIAEIEDLVAMLDEAGAAVEEEVVAVPFGAINSSVLSSSLQRILGSKAQTNTASSTPSSGSSTPAAAPGGGAPDDAAAQARRAEFFQRIMQSRGGGGGASPFGGGGRGGVAPGGAAPGGRDRGGR